MTVEKLDLSSPDLVQGNIEKIQALFPNVVTEGPEGLSIDFDALRQELSDTIVEGPQERYRLDWPGKRAAMLAANMPISKTLRPVREESVDFDTTQNLFIEGDNLDALKLLQDSYLGKVKMIYIDPPYNTGKDFIYKDNFTQDKVEFLKESGQVDEDGGRLVANLESNGRYHSDWLSMMYPRLKLARNLLRDDGVIFISLDDNENSNCRKVCDEIFGADNLIIQICHKARASVSNDKIISPNHNLILLYARNERIVFSKRNEFGLEPSLDGFNKQDNNGKYKLVPVDGPGGAKKGNPFYEFDGIEGYWRFSKDTMQKKYDAGLIVNTGSNLQQKMYLKDAAGKRKTDTSWWDEKFYTANATKNLKKLMGGETFDTPKPLSLLEKMITLSARKDNIILDFFGGSGTTAHAAMKISAKFKGSINCITIQLDEQTNEVSEAAKAGFTTIAEISKERIRRAGAKILEENLDQVGKLDVGFRVLKIDSSNMKDVHADPRELKQGELLDAVSHIKPDRSGEDLLFQVMLNQGIELSQPIARESVEGSTVYIVGQDNLIACFDDNMTDEVVKNIAGRKPLYAIFRDESFKEPADKINAAQIFKQLTEGHTRMKVI